MWPMHVNVAVDLYTDTAHISELILPFSLDPAVANSDKEARRAAILRLWAVCGLGG